MAIDLSVDAKMLGLMESQGLVEGVSHHGSVGCILSREDGDAGWE